ncbi:MAG: hypothetical protein ACRDH5_02350, partial [bacterium]
KKALNDTSRILRSMQEADMLLVAAWSERDEGQWQEGWRQRNEANEEFRKLSRTLNAADTP